MAGIFGLLGLADNTLAAVNDIGEATIFDAANRYLAAHREQMMRFYSVFVEAETEKPQERYMMPGGGVLQRRGGQAQSHAVKTVGYWDVGYPLEDFGAQVAITDVALAYMSVQLFDLHLQTVTGQDVRVTRNEILYRLFNNVQTSFSDEIHGTLLIEPLANGDAVVYPPIMGSNTEATADHYLESNYTAANISDTNNPLVTMRRKLEEPFGTPQGFGSIVVFINSAQNAKISALADFVDAEDLGIIPGADTARITGMPADMPGRVIGRSSGTWVVEWDWIPANYMLGINLDAPKPLKVRRDPASTGLGTGLQLVADSDKWPIRQSHYRHRFGFGVGNRLNGVVMELATGGTYTPPADFA